MKTAVDWFRGEGSGIVHRWAYFGAFADMASGGNPNGLENPDGSVSYPSVLRECVCSDMLDQRHGTVLYLPLSEQPNFIVSRFRAHRSYVHELDLVASYATEMYRTNPHTLKDTA